MLNVFLMGRHSHRTPLSYSVYRNIFQHFINYVERPEQADLIVFGYVTNIAEHADELASLLKKNPSLRLAVISEEPLWDTTNSGDFTKKENVCVVDKYEFKYHVINHVTSPVYEFNEIPYFITTSDDFFARYSFLFRRNVGLSARELRDVWNKAIIKVAFFAEKRTLEKKYDVRFPELDVYGLSVYRTKLAAEYPHQGVLRVGEGWGANVKRQALPDWHLDKLACLDKKAFLVSGIENTHHKYYVSEKIFDAYAALGIPVYFASPQHSVNIIIDNKSYINLYGKDIQSAIQTLTSFSHNDEFVVSYQKTQELLADRFSSVDSYIEERNYVVKKVMAEINAIFEVNSTGQEKR